MQGDRMRARKLKLALVSMSAPIVLAASSAPAQPIAVTPSSLGPGAVSAVTAVAAFYDAHQVQPIWFRGGVDNPTLIELISILNRAPFDGLVDGPSLAAQVQAAIVQAHSGNA